MTRAAAIAPYPVARLTVGEYNQMLEAGVLSRDDDLELLEGWLVPTVAHGPRHAKAVARIGELLTLLFAGSPWRVLVQLPITLADSEPEPDVAVVARDYPDRHPVASEVAAVIEVADSSLAEDRRRKARVYGAGGVPAYVIVTLADGGVELLTEPVGPPRPGYARWETVRTVDVGGTTVSADDLLA